MCQISSVYLFIILWMWSQYLVLVQVAGQQEANTSHCPNQCWTTIMWRAYAFVTVIVKFLCKCKITKCVLEYAWIQIAAFPHSVHVPAWYRQTGPISNALMLAADMFLRIYDQLQQLNINVVGCFGWYQNETSLNERHSLQKFNENTNRFIIYNWICATWQQV